MPIDPIVEKLNLVEQENDDLKEILKKTEERLEKTEREKMTLEKVLAGVVDGHKSEMDAMRLKIRKIRKYAISKEAWYHYAVGSIVTFVAILIAFVVVFKCINQRVLWLVSVCIFMRTIYVWSLRYFGFNV